ncbi:hypothetical protein ADUPG1_011006 [Aduncisulcus paluster]|uniref:Uncharacterized protein n=1 Tax=Aduncisulcus paluster TaxID=2918883 RepID=A0ABQ5JUQ4_9EUKA|nr:hypothetical protein ADUPG1_011006 [Aduncisulcus paluster]
MKLDLDVLLDHCLSEDQKDLDSSSKIAALFTVKEIILCNLELTSCDGVELAAELEKLDLSHNQLKNPIEAVELLPSLYHLNLSYNSLIRIPNIGHLPNLYQLDLTGNFISSIDFSCLPPSLRVLFISENPCASPETRLAITKACPNILHIDGISREEILREGDKVVSEMEVRDTKDPLLIPEKEKDGGKKKETSTAIKGKERTQKKITQQTGKYKQKDKKTIITTKASKQSIQGVKKSTLAAKSNISKTEKSTRIPLGQKKPIKSTISHSSVSSVRPKSKKIVASSSGYGRKSSSSASSKVNGMKSSSKASKDQEEYAKAFQLLKQQASLKRPALPALVQPASHSYATLISELSAGLDSVVTNSISLLQRETESMIGRSQARQEELLSLDVPESKFTRELRSRGSVGAFGGEEEGEKIVGYEGKDEEEEEGREERDEYVSSFDLCQVPQSILDEIEEELERDREFVRKVDSTLIKDDK